MVIFLTIGIFTFLLSSLNQPVEETTNKEKERLYKHFINHVDSAWLVSSLQKQEAFSNIIFADQETTPVTSEPGEDAADDPAFWYNKQNPEKSLIIGSNKLSGLEVFDLDGNSIQTINTGMINNVDIRDGYIYRNKEVALIAGSNQSNNSISLFYLDKGSKILSDTICNIPTTLDGIYGLCMYRGIDKELYVFVNDYYGNVEQWKVSLNNDSISGIMVRDFNLGNKTEGMVADDLNQKLYVSVERKGIVKVDAEPVVTNIQWLNESDSTNINIGYEIEGLALLRVEQTTYLVASCQGNFSYAIFELGENEKYITSFIISKNTVDGVEQTDGIEIFNGYINEDFPMGILIVQDGFNFNEELCESQNFKYISLEKLIKIFG